MTLDPHHLPRSYPEMLQDLIAIDDKIVRLDSTDAKHLRILLTPAIALAHSQLRRIEQAAVKRMIKP